VIEEPFKKPPPEGDGTPAPKPKRYWWRFLLAALVILASTGGATAASSLRFIGSIADDLSHNDVLKNKVDKVLASTEGGEPQNILILGSDKRASEPEDPGRSDTTMLLRLDPGNDAIALMSIPRDLKVEIPGVGTDKFSSAFAYGGPKLTLQVVKELTGLPINHIVNVDYLGFVRAVYAIGCVYVDVDRRYYHSNVGVPASEQYAEINVQPGYQLMCGKRALQYVRYRHTDTDLVRAARQQDFLSAARQRVPATKLAEAVLGKNELIDVFTRYTTSDISDTKAMLEVLELFIQSRNATINEVNFPAELGPSYVYASQSMIDGAVEQFLGIEASGGGRGEIERRERRKRKRAKARQGKREEKAKPKPEPKPKLKPRSPADDELVPAAEAGEEEAKIVARKVSGGFPVFYPTRLPAGAAYEETNPELHIVDPRVYHFKDTDGKRHGAYRMVLTLERSDGIHYFGVQGIQGWSDPPILSGPSITQTIRGRDYEIFLDGDRIRLIVWHRGDNTYWVANSLLRVLTNDQMVGLARSAKVKIPNKKPKRRRGMR
ncbi:MAG TPA: LCP family protein, partial [Solirubrobacterales bacterium]|nr:LCP family protein [Solirubrobacterales bacterium]